MEFADANGADFAPIVEDVIVEGTENLDTILTEPTDNLETVVGTTEPDTNGVVVNGVTSYNLPLIALVVAVVIAGVIFYLKRKKK